MHFSALNAGVFKLPSISSVRLRKGCHCGVTLNRDQNIVVADGDM